MASLKEPFLADAEVAAGTCARRANAHLRKLAYPGPNVYTTEFPRLFFLPRKCKVVSFCIFCILVVLAVTVWKERFEEIGLPPPVLLKFLSLPVVSVLFTYSHIWLALWMTFFPIEFIGIKGCQVPESPFGLGWQGIVPSKARKMSKIWINKITSCLMSLDELFARIDPDAALEEIREPLVHEINEVFAELGRTEAPEAWRLLPEVVKDELVLKFTEDLPVTVRTLMERINADIDGIFDIEEFVVQSCLQDKPLLCDAFCSQGYPELCFIRDCGAIMGLIFGIVQMLQQFFFPAGWLLPVFGVVVGLLTNWLALKMTFAPINPKPLFGGRIVLQGCFLKRQQEFADGYAKYFVDHLANTKRLVPGLAVGSRSDKLCAIIHEEMSAGIDRSARAVRPLIHLAGCTPNYARLKRLAIERMCDRLPELFMKAARYIDTAMDVERTMADRVRAMKVADFEDLLHPIFQEDEWLLILVGGLLGYLVGSVQWMVLGT